MCDNVALTGDRDIEMGDVEEDDAGVEGGASVTERAKGKRRSRSYPSKETVQSDSDGHGDDNEDDEPQPKKQRTGIHLTPYELERERNIARIREEMNNLGILEAAQFLQKKPSKPRKRKATKADGKENVSVGERRVTRNSTCVIFSLLFSVFCLHLSFAVAILRHRVRAAQAVKSRPTATPTILLSRQHHPLLRPRRRRPNRL